MIATYKIQPEMSRFTVRGSAAGLLSGLGHNPVLSIRGFNGEMRFDAAAVENSSLCLKIKAASLEVENDASDKDRSEMKRAMDDDVLESHRYPEITYETLSVAATKLSDSAYRLVIEGNLTLHGVTRRQQVPAQIWVMASQLRANGEFSVRQTDFGIKLVSVAGGTLKLKDELKLTYDIVAAATTEEEKTVCA